MKNNGKAKKPVHRQAHTAFTPYGRGDMYGSGLKNPRGKIKRSYLMPGLSSKALQSPPKSLA